MRAPHLGKIEWLDQVVVGPGVEALDAHCDLVLRRCDDHGDLAACRAHVPQQVEATAIGQVEVQQHQFVVDPGDGKARVVDPLHPVHGMASGKDIVADGGAQHMVIFDQQDSQAWRSPCAS